MDGTECIYQPLYYLYWQNSASRLVRQVNVRTALAVSMHMGKLNSDQWPDILSTKVVAARITILEGWTHVTVDKLNTWTQISSRQ